MEIKQIAGVGAAAAFGAALLMGGTGSAQAATPIYEVVNGNSSNSCMQVSGTGDPRNVVLGSCDLSAKQIWTISNGVFRNPASNHCLDGNGADVYTHVCNGGDYQKWHTSSGDKKYITHDKSGKYLSGSGVVGSDAYFATSASTSSRWVIKQVGTI